MAHRITIGGSKRRSPGKVRTKFHHTRPVLPKPLSKVLPQRQLQTPASHPEASVDQGSFKPWGQPPPDKYMNPSEWAVYWALMQLIGEPNFIWRYPVAFARYTFGYFTPFLDFFVPGRSLAILLDYVNGETGFSEYGVSRNNLLRVELTGEGLGCVFIDSTAADDDPIYYTSEALNGRDHSSLLNGV